MNNHIPSFDEFVNEDKMGLNTTIKTSDKKYTWIYQTGKDSHKTELEINKKLNALGIKSFISKTTGDTIAIPTKDLKTAFDKVISGYSNIKQFAYDDGTEIDKSIVNESFHMPDGTPIDVDKNHMPVSESNISDLQKLLSSHDWYYMFSDDNRAYQKGSAEEKAIKDLAKKLGKEGEELYKAAFIKHFPNANK